MTRSRRMLQGIVDATQAAQDSPQPTKNSAGSQRIQVIAEAAKRVKEFQALAAELEEPAPAIKKPPIAAVAAPAPEPSVGFDLQRVAALVHQMIETRKLARNELNTLL